MDKRLQSKTKPVSIPSGAKTALGRVKQKSILKNSFESDYCYTPDTNSPTVSKSSVKFNEENVQSPDYYFYDKGSLNGTTIVSPMAAFREIAASKSFDDSRDVLFDDADSLHGEEGSDDDDDDDVTSHRSDSPVVHMYLSSSMSNEAQYAALKAYEDELHERLIETFPAVEKRLANIRSASPEMHTTKTFDPDFADLDHESVTSSNPHRVANRLQMAMDIMDSVRESQGEERASGSFHSRQIAKDPIRSFEKWCGSLRYTLEDLGLAIPAD